MSLVAVSLLWVLGAQPVEVDAVIITRKSGLNAAQAAELQQKLTRALEVNGLKVKTTGPALQAALKRLGVKDPAACNARRSCIEALAAQLQAPALVSVSVSRVETDTAIALELIREGETQSTVKDSFVAPRAAALETFTQVFATRVTELLAPRVAEPPPAPVATPKPNLVPPDPAPPPTPPLVVDTTPPAKNRTVPVALATVGGLSLAAGIALVVVGAVTRGTLAGQRQPDGRLVSELDEQTAVQRNAQANVFTGGGIGAAAVGAGLLTGAIITW